MSKTTASLEAAVAAIKANAPEEGQCRTRRQGIEDDRLFAAVLKILAPRFRHFIRQYGLVSYWDDAEQACAIAVHRAIQSYDPEKAKFTTFVNWQIRGELQSLRFRVMTDQRPSARKVEASTVSLDALASGEDGEAISAVASIEDEDALMRTESGASDYLAHSAMQNLTDEYIRHMREVEMERIERRNHVRARAERKKRGKVDGMVTPAARRRSVWRNENQLIDADEMANLEARLDYSRRVIERRLFNISLEDDTSDDAEMMHERSRQIAKRAARAICELTGQDPRFEMMAEYYHARGERRTTH
ncbi:sigma-70 family RNA polymerase sigma factor [Novosphingobium profundi]|uniref:sigma factor n=1 Tax=Novosphingobium profundi TaxID=1774954 RepID=UPI001BD9B32E|nr:sigma factor [Novosphingobium profundi]MBT0670562.1 sigma-70 family RNA polymerase sigma factor [Novosphingobium profundi]